jgi:dienelactone hydrolase
LLTLARHPAIDPDRIGVIGFSKGGTVVIKTALRRYAEPLTKNQAGFALGIAVYPWCNDYPLDMRATSAPLYVLSGSNDTYVSVPGCLDYAKRVQDAGGKVTTRTYKGKHGWDTPGAADWTDKQGENQSKCFFDEVSRGTWVERGSKVVVMENNKPTGNSSKAVATCMTRGVSGGYSREAHLASLEDIRGFMRDALRLK